MDRNTERAEQGEATPQADATGQEEGAGEAGRPVSDAKATQAIDQEQEQSQTAQLNMNDTRQEKGEVTSVAVADGPPIAESRTRESRREATNRWIREGRTAEVEAFRDDERAKCTAAGMSRPAARDEAWVKSLATFPPPGVDPVEASCSPLCSPSCSPGTPPPCSPGTGVTGLGDIPADWPALPPNASLVGEIQWVQSNRLSVVSGAGESASVDLSRALSPAPSHAAIGWLETSIRAYSKYCDIAAKATSQQEDEREHVRRERIAIKDIRTLLAEMVDGE